MPEGDYVRRVVRRLDGVLTGSPITYCLLRWPTLGGIDLTGHTVTSIDAYGKHILMHLTRPGVSVLDTRAGLSPRGPRDVPERSVELLGATRLTLRTHLRMDGTYHIERAAAGRPAPGSRAHRWTSRAVLATAQWTVIGQRLGMADLVPTRDVRRLIGHLGPDIMADDFDAESGGAAVIAQGERPVGATLLDQTVVAGIGTIYLAEGLFAWRCHPHRASGAIPDPAGLLSHIRGLLWRSVHARTGTATGDTRRGYTTLAHGRENRPCRRCRTPIQVVRVGAPPMDRPAFFCPECQPK